MKEEFIKEILFTEQKKISSENFNEKIIQQLKISAKQEKILLFDEKSIVRIFLITSLIIFVANLNFVKKLTSTDMIVGTFICLIPIFFMVFNKIYQLKIQKFSNQ